MYDVSALSVSAPQVSGASARRAGGADDQDAGGNFGDLIDRAGRNDSGHGGRGQDKQAAEEADDGKTTGKGRGLDAAAHQDNSRSPKGQIAGFDPAAMDLDLIDSLGMTPDELEGALADQNPANGNPDPSGRLRVAPINHKQIKPDQSGANPKAALTAATLDVDAKLLAKQEKDAQNVARKDEKLSPFQELNALLGVEVADQPEELGEAEQDKHVHNARRMSTKTRDDDDGKAGDAKTEETSAKVDRATDKNHVAHHDPILAEQATVSVKSGAGAAASQANDALAAITTDRSEQPARMSLSDRIDADKIDSDHEDAVNTSKTEFVTVLDSRRYLGLGSEGGNISKLADAIRGDQGWVGRLSGTDALAGNTSTEVNTLKLQLNPEHLGSMTASLRLKGEELSVELRVDTIEAYRQLSGDQDSIVKALKDQGFNIDQVSVQLNPSAKSDSGQSGGQYPSDGGNQAQQGGAQGESARQRDDSARRNANQNNWTANDASTAPVETSADRNSVASGNLYL